MDTQANLAATADLGWNDITPGSRVCVRWPKDSSEQAKGEGVRTVAKAFRLMKRTKLGDVWLMQYNLGKVIRIVPAAFIRIVRLAPPGTYVPPTTKKRRRKASRVGSSTIRLGLARRP